MKKKISITISEKTLKAIDSIIDNIYVRNRSQAIELLVNNALGEKKIAVILSGGPEEEIKIGEEFRISAKINGSSVIEELLKKLSSEKFRKIYIIGRKKVINSVFSLVQNGSKYGVKIEYIEEKESKGTYDSLRLVKGMVNTTFLVVYGDTYINNINLEELWNMHLKRKGVATLLLTTTPEPSKKGIVKIEGFKILEFIQKPEKSDVYIGFSSVFVTQPEILEYEGNSLEEDIFPELAKRGLLSGYISTAKVIKFKRREDLKKIESS